MNEVGHQIVSYMMMKELTPAALAAYKKLTADPNDPMTGKSTSALDNGPESAATWMDDIRPEDANMHFVNAQFDSVSLADLGTPAGDNAITFVTNAMNTLRSKTASEDQKGEAVRICDHLAGDFAQPLHDSERVDQGKPDRGGNEVPFNWLKGKSFDNNLHAYWDAGAGRWLPKFDPRTAKTPQAQATAQAAIAQFGDAILAKYPASYFGTQAQVQDPATWAAEGLAIAKTDCYQGVTPNGSPSPAYAAMAANDMDMRAALFAHRLADFYNQVLPGAA